MMNAAVIGNTKPSNARRSRTNSGEDWTARYGSGSAVPGGDTCVVMRPHLLLGSDRYALDGRNMPSQPRMGMRAGTTTQRPAAEPMRRAVGAAPVNGQG